MQNWSLQNEKTTHNFKELRESEQKEVIIEYTKKMFAAEGKSIRLKDLELLFINEYHIKKIFGSIRKLCVLAGVPTDTRKASMTAVEFISYIQGLAKVDPSNFLCPSYQKPDTVCFLECSCWTTEKLCRTKSGRSKIFYNGQTTLLYRTAYVLLVGPITEDLSILHLCDNPSCFNPKHLIQGTSKDNAEHCIKRNRRKPTSFHKPHHRIKNPYDYPALLAWVKANSIISEKGEWLYSISIEKDGYARICISNIHYSLHRLILANKLGILYEDVELACHEFPETSLFAGKEPCKNDVNPDHLHNGDSSRNTLGSLKYSKGCKLSPDQVDSIWDEASKTDFSKTSAMEFDTSLAKKLGVSAEIIKGVRRNKTYTSWHNNKAISWKASSRKLPVIQLDMEGNFIAKHASAIDAGKVINKSGSGISGVCNGRLAHFGGYIWMHESKYLVFLSTAKTANKEKIKCKI